MHELDDDSMSVRTRRSRAAGSFLDGGLFSLVDENLAAQARKIVTQAIKEHRVAIRLMWVVQTQEKKKPKLPKGQTPMPGCCNKYHLIGKVRIVEVIFCFPDCTFTEEQLYMMQKEDLQDLQDFLLCLERPCAVLSKIPDQNKAHSVERYKSLVHNRFTGLKMIKRGDSKYTYYDIDYSETGAYSKVQKKIRQVLMIISIQHISRITVKLATPLEAAKHRLEDNHRDWDAKLVGEDSCQQIHLAKLFVKSGHGDKLPTYLKDERVGQAAASTPSPKEESVWFGYHGCRPHSEW